MDILTQVHLFLHVTAGISTLIAGPIAIFYNFKNPKNHRIAGKVFFYAMLYVCASAVVGYFRHSDQIFYQFLLGIAVLVASGVIFGVRAIQMMKGGTVRRFDYLNAGFLLLFGIWMLTQAALRFDDPEGAFIPILFAVFGTGALTDSIGMLRKMWRAATLPKMDWYLAHVGSMFGAFTGSTTAFLVNVASNSLPWYIVWFGPTLALLPLRIYFTRKVKKRN
jgi:hypothetical protein